VVGAQLGCFALDGCEVQIVSRLLPPRLISRRYEAGVAIPAAAGVLILGRILPGIWFWPVAAVISAIAFFLVLRPIRIAETAARRGEIKGSESEKTESDDPTVRR
jgi:hypothetical protein